MIEELSNVIGESHLYKTMAFVQRTLCLGRKRKKCGLAIDEITSGKQFSLPTVH